MNRLVLFFLFSLSVHHLQAQSYSLSLSNIPNHTWEAASWSPGAEQPGLSHIVTAKNLFNTPKELLVNMQDQEAYKLTRKNDKWVMTDGEVKTRLVASRRHYVMGDGVRLVRRCSQWNRRIEILDEDGRLLAQSDIDVGFFARHALEVRIVQPSPYDQDILAMLTVDTLDQLRTIVLGVTLF